MAKTNTGLVEFVKACLGRPYIYGTFGQVVTAALIDAKAKQYPKQLTPARVQKAKAEFIGKRADDCIGLIKNYLWATSPDANPVYNAAEDWSADATYNKATEKGPISTMPDIPGICVRTNGHVGVYIGNGEVIEAKGFNYGVVKTRLNARSWLNWYKHPLITYDAQIKPNTDEITPVKSITQVAREVIAGLWGNGSDRKARLTAAGYNYDAVQMAVNNILAGGSGSENKSVYLIVNTQNSALNMRATPNGAIIGSVPKGAKVELIQKTTPDWYKVKYNGKTGFCYSKYLKA